MVLVEDGHKMSKSRGNVINPDEIVKVYGADALRIYEMFMGPFDQAISWSQNGLVGCHRFLSRVWNLFNGKNKNLASQELCFGRLHPRRHPPAALCAAMRAGSVGVFRRRNKITGESGKEIVSMLHRLIKKVSEDLEEMKFNTAIAAMMEFINYWQQPGQSLSKKDAEIFTKLLSPFAPHLAEELWSGLGLLDSARSKHKKSIFYEKWPEFDPKLIREEIFELVAQVNGKVRDTISAPIDISEKEAKELALGSEKIQKWVEGKEIKKVIFVKNRLINLII
jgi:leucyl-tRNA synthetase